MKMPRRLVPAMAAVATLAIPALSFASEADLILPEEFRSPEPLKLSKSAERDAEAAALYVQALFEEESDGPDRALETKRRVLALDPGFAELAVDCAHQYLRRGETSEAIAVLKDAAKAGPKSTTPALTLSTIYLRQLQKPDLAEKYALQALNAAPGDPAVYETLCEVYRSSSQRSKVESLFQRALKRNKESPEFWLRMAELRLREPGAGGRITEPVANTAAELAEHAVTSTTDARDVARAADVMIVAGRPDRAAELYAKAIGIKPSLEGVRERLAVCLLQSGKSEDAVKVLEENVKANPLDLASYDLLGKIYWESGDYTRALANVRQSLLLAPPDPVRLDAAVRLALLSNAPESALAYAEEAARSFPKAPEFYIYKAVSLGELGKHVLALRAFDDAAVQAGISRPDLLDGEFYFSYGVTAERAGQFQKAGELLLKSIEIDPARSAKACNYLGYMWADRNENLDQAESLIQRALQQDPDNGAYLDSLGWVLYRKGRFSEALAELLRASAALPEPDATVFEHIGDTYEKLGKVAEAVLYWQKAAKLSPDDKALAAKLDASASRLADKPARNKETGN